MKWKFWKKEDSNWDLVDAVVGKWELRDSNVLPPFIKMALYKIYFSPELKKYKLEIEGYRPKEHEVYNRVVQFVKGLESGLVVGSAAEFLNIPKLNNPSKNKQKQKTISNKIIVLEFGIKENAEEILKYRQKDNKLINRINSYKNKYLTEKQDIEIFEQKDNIIITNKGYYVAVYEKDVI